MQHFHARTTRKKNYNLESIEKFFVCLKSFQKKFEWSLNKEASFIYSFWKFFFTASKFPNFRLNRKRSDHEKKIKYETKLNRIYVSMFVTYSHWSLGFPYFTAKPKNGISSNKCNPKREFYSLNHVIFVNFTKFEFSRNENQTKIFSIKFRLFRGHPIICVIKQSLLQHNAETIRRKIID